MLTKRLTYLLLCGAVACQAIAQDSLLLRDYSYVKQHDAWLSLPGTAALTRYQLRNIVEAEATLTKGNGGLVDYYQSDNWLEGNISIESLYRLNERTVLFGAISYNNWSGKEMTGSAFIDPTRKPFNLVESDLENAGKKHQDTYRLTGGVGVDVYQGISLGARIDYTSANYAKYKDLRHKNKLMDLRVTASVYAPVRKWMNVGADYQYHRNTESLEFGTYGKGDKVYKTLIDYGTFMGLTEQFGNEGYTDKTREMPLFEDAHRGALQIEVLPLPALSMLGSLSFSHGTGYYGRKSPYTITYTNHERDITEVKGIVTYRTPRGMHRLDVSYAREKLENRAETFRGLTNSNGATYYEYYDATKMADKKWKDLHAGYTAFLGINGELPTWTLTADYHWTERQQVTYLYPYYRLQQLRRHEFGVSATRRFVCQKGVWAVMLRGMYLKGSGDPYEDGTFVAPSDKQEVPATMEALLQREYHYLTAPQFGFGGQVKYTFRFPGTEMTTFVKADAEYRRTSESNAYEKGKDHTGLSLSIGCTF